MEEKNKFVELYNINVNEHTEEKNGLTYLSWSWAWAEIKKKYENATYEILKFENNLPYVYDEKTGYMVFTRVTINDLTHEMWLPVMDGANKAMKDKPYTYKVKTWNNYTKSYEIKEKEVVAATMFDINKTIMRCLVKNLAMFGLGLYIYAGEDLPETIEEQKESENGLLIDGKKIETITNKTMTNTTTNVTAKKPVDNSVEKVDNSKKDEIDLNAKIGGNGKYKDKTWLEVYKENPTYLQWCIDNSKTETSKAKYKKILDTIKENEWKSLNAIANVNNNETKVEGQYITISDEEANAIFNL